MLSKVHQKLTFSATSNANANVSGYTPWTALLGSQTPCFSSISATITPPPISSDLNTQTNSKPTVAVTGVVFAMTYPLPNNSSDEGGLSPGAIAGVVVGIAAGILAMIGIGIFIHRHRKHTKRLADLKSELRHSFYARNEGTSEVPTTPMTMRAGVDPNGTRRQVSLGSMSLAQSEARRHVSTSAGEHHSISRPAASHDAVHSLNTPTEERGDGSSRPSSPPSPAHELYGIHEVQLARPQRLSRGYARIVHTHTQNSNGSTPAPSIG